ncbi:hypothetical protein Hanom_Chr16g01492561 [Helianthus anomalus]
MAMGICRQGSLSGGELGREIPSAVKGTVQLPLSIYLGTCLFGTPVNLRRRLLLTIWVSMLFNLKDPWMTRIMTGGWRRRLLPPVWLISCKCEFMGQGHTAHRLTCSTFILV